MRTCCFCQFALDAKLEIHRTSTCPACGRDLKVCKNCRFYTPGVHWDCRETIPEPVYDKERSNFCEYFRFRSTSDKTTGPDKQKEAKRNFDKLFGD